MLYDVIIFIVGLTLIIVGANGLTDGATALARRFKVSELVIGLTIVALGSSAPDFVVALFSTLSGKSAIALGDVVGADIFDILMVIGVCTLANPIVLSRPTLTREVPMVILAAAVLFICGNDGLIDGRTQNLIDRSDGLLILLFFCVYMVITFMMAREKGVAPEPQTVTTADSDNKKTTRHSLPLRFKPEGGILQSLIYIALGLAGLIFGGNWIVDGAEGIARRFGMSEAMVGLTIVGIGGSVPDFFTSFVAALKGHSSLAVGNVVGSCVFNILFVIGTCSTVRPLTMGNIGIVDFSVLLGAAVLLWLFGRFWGKRTICRWEGAVLVLCYVAYFVYLVLNLTTK